MFSIPAFTLIAALASAFVVRADVVPSEPSPGSVYNEGATCPIVWDADPDSPTIWKNMNIELMSGDNLNMVHITTVATNQDGTVNGRFGYPCPDVTVNSAIYFYQFTSPLTANKTWTTRFTIASATGETTPPANPTQPGTGEKIPWGVGALADPSKAVPAPDASSVASNATSSSGLIVPSSSPALVPSAAHISSSSVDVGSSSSRVVVTAIASAPSSAPSSTSSNTAGSNGAVALSATSTMASLIIFTLALMLF
ncbi:hypothetical protein AN958_10394 [Leucoagaricus sp. SymC.cos]|nr:hypothetical protein AN958_10394 [Leucoagaricus sp. SymC.cos]